MQQAEKSAKIVNGVNVTDMYDTIDAIKGRPLVVYFSKESASPLPGLSEIRFDRIGDLIR